MPRDPNNPRWGFQLVPIKDRFMAKVRVDASSGCWLWMGTITKPMGYGRFGVDPNRSDWAHRASWGLFHGPIPSGLQIDHLCRVPACVNPNHLETVTHRENIRRSFVARFGGRCQSGKHEMTQANRLLDRNGDWHGCRRCYNDRQIEGRRRRAFAAAIYGEDGE